MFGRSKDTGKTYPIDICAFVLILGAFSEQTLPLGDLDTLYMFYVSYSKSIHPSHYLNVFISLRRFELVSFIFYTHFPSYKRPPLRLSKGGLLDTFWGNSKYGLDADVLLNIIQQDDVYPFRGFSI